VGSIEPDGTLKEARQNTLRNMVREILANRIKEIWNKAFKDFCKYDFILVFIEFHYFLRAINFVFNSIINKYLCLIQ
jgi:hypothetical protein